MLASTQTNPFKTITSAPLAALDNLFAKRSRGEIARSDTSDWFDDYEWRGNNKSFMDSWFSNEAHTMLLAGPAETGKTLSCLAILHKIALDNPGAEMLMLRKVRRHTYNTVCRSMFKIWPKDWEEKGYVIYGGVNSPEIFIWPNGSRCYVGGLDSLTQSETLTTVSALLSGEFDVIYINQAEELSRSDIDKVSTRATGRKGGLSGARLGGVLMDCNPSHPGSPLLEMEREGSLVMYKSRHQDNPDLYDGEGELTERGRVTMGVLKRQKNILYERLYLGNWVGAGGSYFRSYDPQLHGIRKADFRLPLGAEVWLSCDYGYAHPNVFLCHAQMMGGTMVTFQEVVSVRKKPSEIAPVVHAVLASWGLVADDLTCYIGTDAFSVSGRSDQTIIEKYQGLGFNMIKADVGPGSRVRHGHALIDMLGDSDEGDDPTWYYVRDTCPRLEETLPAMIEDPRNPEAPAKIDANSEGQGGDDCYDALVYGLRTNPASSSMSNLDNKLKHLKEQHRMAMP